MQRWRRTCQLISELGSQLQQARTVKASTTKLPVVLLQDVDGLGTAGKATKVNHGYARNYLIPQRLATVERKPGAAAAAGAAVGTVRNSGAAKTRLDEESRRQKEAVQQRRQLEALIKKLTGTPLTLKRKTQPDSPALDQPITPKDIAEAVARQMRIEIVPELLELERDDTLKLVGEYRLPLKLVLPSGARAMLDLNVLST